MNKLQETQFLKAQKLAESKGGILLSEEYVNNRTNLYWKCSLGHKFLSCYNNVIDSGLWCPKCSINNRSERQRNPNGLKLAQEYALSKGGLCLSIEYINSDLKLEWKCHNELHPKFLKSYYHAVNRGQWCPECTKDFISDKFRNKNGLKIAQEYALSKGGLCLSIEYKNNISKLKWKCHNEMHQYWIATYNNVVNNGTWCPECKNNYVQENRVKNILEYLLDLSFIKAKLSWNINPETNRILELDGYDDNKKIAFEYQGDHHHRLAYKNMTNDDLCTIKRKDQYKKENCLKNNVVLIVVNTLPSNGDNKFELFMNEIYNSINSANLHINKSISEEILKKIFNTITNSDIQKEKLNISKETALLRKGFCLSEFYVNNITKMTWKCENNHIWQANFNNIVNKKSWCPICSRKKRKF